MLRISVASAANDHRLGALEAPPAIVSMFLGDELSEILEAIEKDEPYGAKEKELLKVGVHVLPKFPKDTTDRNRTAPFAFTGNKFEFRMLGSSDSVAEPNVVLNTAAAEALRQFADELETAENFEEALHDLIQRTVREHKKIIFNGNCYDEAWVGEAEKRGLLNLKTTPDALSHLLDKKNIELYATHKIYTEAELKSRLEILLENYCKIVNIEALTMVDMMRKDILPAVSEYISTLSNGLLARSEFDFGKFTSFEKETATVLSALSESAYQKLKKLEKLTAEAAKCENSAEKAAIYKDKVIVMMEELRADADRMETLTAADYWPFPTYGELLFGVR